MASSESIVPTTASCSFITVTDEKDLRRLFFITYGKEVSAEQHAWFEEEQFVRGCAELTEGKQEQEPEKKAKKA